MNFARIGDVKICRWKGRSGVKVSSCSKENTRLLSTASERGRVSFMIFCLRNHCPLETLLFFPMTSGSPHSMVFFPIVSFSMSGRFLAIISSNIFSGPFFFWNPYNVNVGVLDVVPEVSLTVLLSFHSFFFVLWQWFPPLCLLFIYPFFCFIYSAIDCF